MDLCHSGFRRVRRLSPELCVNLYTGKACAYQWLKTNSILHKIVDTTQSYAFQNFNAVYSLCRTILETAMRDVGIRIGEIQTLKDDREFYKEYPPRKLINTVSSGRLRDKIHDLYSELSSLIHGYKTVTEETAKNALKETLMITQELYDKNVKK